MAENRISVNPLKFPYQTPRLRLYLELFLGVSTPSQRCFGALGVDQCSSSVSKIWRYPLCLSSFHRQGGRHTRPTLEMGPRWEKTSVKLWIHQFSPVCCVEMFTNQKMENPPQCWIWSSKIRKQTMKLRFDRAKLGGWPGKVWIQPAKIGWIWPLTIHQGLKN